MADLEQLQKLLEDIEGTRLPSSMTPADRDMHDRTRRLTIENALETDALDTNEKAITEHRLTFGKGLGKDQRQRDLEALGAQEGRFNFGGKAGPQAREPLFFSPASAESTHAKGGDYLPPPRSDSPFRVEKIVKPAPDTEFTQTLRGATDAADPNAMFQPRSKEPSANVEDRRGDPPLDAKGQPLARTLDQAQPVKDEDRAATVEAMKRHQGNPEMQEFLRTAHGVSKPKSTIHGANPAANRDPNAGTEERPDFAGHLVDGVVGVLKSFVSKMGAAAQYKPGERSEGNAASAVSGFQAALELAGGGAARTAAKGVTGEVGAFGTRPTPKPTPLEGANYGHQEVLDWAQKSGLNAHVRTTGEGTKYVHIRDPANPAQPVVKVRLPEDGHVGKGAQFPGRIGNEFDAGVKPQRSGYQGDANVLQNVSGESFADFKTLTKALEHRFSTSPEGFKLTAPDKAAAGPLSREEQKAVGQEAARKADPIKDPAVRDMIGQMARTGENPTMMYNKLRRSLGIPLGDTQTITKEQFQSYLGEVRSAGRKKGPLMSVAAAGGATEGADLKDDARVHEYKDRLDEFQKQRDAAESALQRAKTDTDARDKYHELMQVYHEMEEYRRTGRGAGGLPREEVVKSHREMFPK